MNTPKTNSNSHGSATSVSGTPLHVMARNAAGVLYRRRWVVAIGFAGIFAIAALISLHYGNRYQANMMILVSQNERADTPVNGQPGTQPITQVDGVTVEEMNSEVALLQSRDLLRQVVVGCGLDQYHPNLWQTLDPRHNGFSPRKNTAEAVRELADNLKISILPMSNMIAVSYTSANPELAARVLETLSAAYMKKHSEMHQPAGVYAFFEQQAQRYHTALASDESQLVNYAQSQGVISAPEETTAALQRISDFEAMQDETHAAAFGTEQRIKELEKELNTMAPRMTTSVKTSDDDLLIQNLKSTLLNLELNRTQLLDKYQPTYRPVVEVEKQIAEAQSAIAKAEQAHWREVTTDRDPAFEAALTDLTTARADLADDEARTSAIGQEVAGLKSRATWLQQQGVVQQNMMRNFKTAEADYLLYLSKAEEARIENALDTRRILNVALAESPTVPALPVHSALWSLAISGFAAGLAAIGLAFVSDNLDPTVRTPNEVEMLLDLPILGILPKRNGDGRNGHAVQANGNGHGNGNGNGHGNGNGNGNGNGHGRIETHVS